MSVSPESSVSQRDVNSLPVDSRPFFPFEVFTQLGGMSPQAVQAVQRMYEMYCQACVSMANLSHSECEDSGCSSGTTSSTNSRPNRRQRRRASRQARSRRNSSVSISQAKAPAVDSPGYCYLRLIGCDYRAEVAADLGANPSLADLARLPQAKVSKDLSLRFEKTAEGRWHCGERGSYSTEQLMGSLKRVYCTILGSFGSGFMPMAGPVVSHADRLGYKTIPEQVGGLHDFSGVKRELRQFVERSDRNGILVYSMEDVWLSQLSAKHVDRSMVLRSAAMPRGKSLGSEAWFDLSSDSLTVAKCPAGASVMLNGAHYQVPGSVFVVFKRNVSFSVTVNSVVRSLDVVALTGSRTLSKLVEFKVPAKSTEARFFREMGGVAVLSRPSCMASSDGHPNVVSLTDPLQDWVAVQEDRLEGCFSGKFVLTENHSYDWFALKSFRSSDNSILVLDGAIRVDNPEVTLLFPDTCYMKVLRKIDSGSLSEEEKWSVRRSVVADPYCMDGGGPSDSDFSDAI